MAVAAGAWLFIVGQLRGLVRALRAGEPFARANELRLRQIGLAVIAFALGRAVLGWGTGLYLTGKRDPSNTGSATDPAEPRPTISTLARQ